MSTPDSKSQTLVKRRGNVRVHSDGTTRLFRNRGRIDQDARRRHLYIVGTTGAGKSTLLVNLIDADMAPMEAKTGSRTTELSAAS